MLPYPSRRTTFTMIRSPGSLRLRVEAQAVRGASFQHVDRTTHDDKRWGASLRAEYALEPAPAALAKVRLARSFGPDGELEGVRRQPELPDAITLACKTEAVKVRPADAEQRPGRGGGGDGVAKPSWAPASVEVVPNALVCKLGEDDQDEVLLPFTEALTFVPARKSGKSEAAGVEWAFDNSDMVIQHGGLRWIPASAVTTSP